MSGRSGLYALLAAVAAAGCDDVAAPLQVEQGEPAFAVSQAPLSRIVYVGAGRLGTDIFMMDEDGGTVRQITRSAAVESNPVLSPNGLWIAYARDGQIWRVSSSGGTPEAIYSEPGYIVDQPAWSSDGSEIAFTHRPSGGIYRDIRIMDAGVPHTSLSAASTAADEHSPTWYPGTASVTYVVGTAPSGTISGVGFGHDPEWSPDGTRLVYSKPVPGVHDNWQIYVYDFAGAGEQRVTDELEEWDDTHPTWSPDGTEIAFVRRHETLSTPGQRGIYKVLASPPYPTTLLVNGQFNRTPHWSSCDWFRGTNPCF